MKKVLFAAVVVFTATASFAQSGDDTMKHKRYIQQAGVQINELFRQIFNFNGNAAAANTNPYLFTYSINSARSGLGLRIGVGYNYQSLTNDDGISRRSTDLNDLQARLGVEKLFTLSRKWSAGAGIDGVLNHNDDYTKNIIRGFDTVTTVTKTKITSYGGGGMLWLRYHVTNRVLIGTETSFYYSIGQQNDDIAITQKKSTGSGTGQLVTTTSTVDNRRIDGKLSIPVAFFLLVRF